MEALNLSTPGFDPAGMAQQQQARLDGLRRKAQGGEALDKVAKEFESVFISQMLGQMWQGVEVDKTFGGGHAEEMFRGLLVEEYGKEMAKAGGLGLADHVKRQLLQMQEVGP